MPDDQKFVRNDSDKRRGARFPLFHAFTCAAQGIGYAFTTQRNIKIYIVVAALAIVLGFLLGISAIEWIAIILCMSLVFAGECLNTAIESVVDMVSPEYSDLAKHAKNCAAGAVLVCSISSLIVAAFIFIPPVLTFIS